MSRLFKEGSNADEPTNINLSDYSSDGGDTSSSSSEEEVERRSVTDDLLSALRVPPPSPVLPRREHNTPKVVGKSPPPARRSLRIRQANITMSPCHHELDDNSSDAWEHPTDVESDGPWLQSSSRVSRTAEGYRGSKCSWSSNMPPELKVTPVNAQDTDVKDQTAVPRPKSDESTQTWLGQSWHHLRLVPLSRPTQRNQSDLAIELQTKIGSSLRQKIWTGIPVVCHSSDTDTHWSKSALFSRQHIPEENLSVQSMTMKQKETSPSRSVYNEHLLTSCSEKLEILQKKGFHQSSGLRSRGKKIRSKRIKNKTDLNPNIYSENRSKGVKLSLVSKSQEEKGRKMDGHKKRNGRRMRLLSSSDDERTEVSKRNAIDTDLVPTQTRGKPRGKLKPPEMKKNIESDLKPNKSSVNTKQNAKEQSKNKEFLKNKLKELEKRLIGQIMSEKHKPRARRVKVDSVSRGGCFSDAINLQKLQQLGLDSFIEDDNSDRQNENVKSKSKNHSKVSKYPSKFCKEPTTNQLYSEELNKLDGITNLSKLKFQHNNESSKERKKRSFKWKLSKNDEATSDRPSSSLSEAAKTRTKISKKKLIGKKTKAFRSMSSSETQPIEIVENDRFLNGFVSVVK